MHKTAVSPSRKYLICMLLVLLTAVFLRLFAITTAPPGLTHDEADHGITALSIVNGVRDIYFTIGYGREPLFDYVTALLMSAIGTTFLAGRLTAVFSSLIMIAGMAAWVRRGFNWQTAVFTAAGLAVGFWPVMTARQSLRSEMLPTLFVLAVYLFWRGLQQTETKEQAATYQNRLFYFLGGGFMLGLTFYTYIPARILWLVFPVTLVYIAWQKRPLFQKIWKQTLLMLGVALFTSLPLLLYLLTNPGAESRIGQLSQPLTAAANGDFSLLWRHIGEGLGIIALTGDGFWRYNLAGQPLLPLLMALLFGVGLLLAVWRLGARTTCPQSADKLSALPVFFAVVWLLLGLSPVLVTGARLSTTQAIGMQPVLYLFPALALHYGTGWLAGHNPTWKRWAWTAVLLIFGTTAVLTYHTYFNLWANHPDVRVEYETTLVTALAYLNQQGSGKTAVSTITPHAVHSPAVATMTLPNQAVTLSWFDGRNSLLLPAGASSTLLFPGFTPLNPALDSYFETAVLSTTLPLRDTDRNRPLDIYRVDSNAMRQQWQTRFNSNDPVRFGEKATFLGYDLHTPTVKPGDVVSIATWWQAERPFADGVLFTQILDANNQPIAQADYLSVPSDLWQPGDQFIQLHQMTIPETTPPGDYPLIIGLYRCPATCPAEIAPQSIPADDQNYLTLPTTLTVLDP